MHTPHLYREHDPTINASDRGTANLYLSHTTTFRVSRALLGHRLANAPRFPPSRTLGLLPLIRQQRRLTTAAHALSPRRRHDWQAHRTAFLLDHAVLPTCNYRFPRSPTLTKGP